MSLELKKIKLELMRVQTARMDMELKIDERKEEIQRLEDHIKIQSDKELELSQKIQDLSNKG